MSTPRITPEESDRMTNALQTAQKRQAIEYALTRQVPEMPRGFTVTTNYGDIVIEPGWMADRMTEAMQRALQCELMELDRTNVAQA